jgi:hypothetical protein
MAHSARPAYRRGGRRGCRRSILMGCSTALACRAPNLAAYSAGALGATRRQGVRRELPRQDAPGPTIGPKGRAAVGGSGSAGPGKRSRLAEKGTRPQDAAQVDCVRSLCFACTIATRSILPCTSQR